jgi:membrane protein
VRDQLLLRAHSLTFLMVLSLVPLLALAVSIVDLVGASDSLVRLIVSQVAAGSPAAIDYILPLVERLDFGALGTVGGAILIATTVSTIGNVERALNAIWGVRQQRPWVRRVPDYLAVLVISPLLLGVALSLGASLRSQWVVQRLLELPGFGRLWSLGLALTPMLLAGVGFTFLYWFLPNTTVRPSSALLGGLVAGILFALAQRAYLGFSVGVARSNVVFGTFAMLPLLLVWIYFSWAIILLGAEVAYAHQTLPQYRREVRGGALGTAARETLGLAIALEVARSFAAGRADWNEEGLSDALDVSLRAVRDVVAALEEANILARRAGERSVALQLARPAGGVSVADVLAALRGPRRIALAPAEVERTVTEVLGCIDTDAARVAASRSLDDLVRASAPCGPDGGSEVASWAPARPAVDPSGGRI